MSIQRETSTEAAIEFEFLVGCPLFTSDGDELGRVKQIEGAYLKVDAPMKRDYWLSTENLTQTSTDGAIMAFTKSELDDHKLSEPGLQPEDDRVGEVMGDALITPEEQLEQRERMARELAAQRERLPHEHPGGAPDAPPDTGGTVGEPVEAELARVEAQAPKLESSVGDVATARSVYEAAATGKPLAEDAPAMKRPATGGVVPSADRVPETINKPITDEPSVRDRTPADPPPITAGNTQPEARERFHAPEYGTGSFEHEMMPEARSYGRYIAAIAATGFVGLAAVLWFLRRRRSRRTRIESLRDAVPMDRITDAVDRVREVVPSERAQQAFERASDFAEKQTKAMRRTAKSLRS